MNHPRRAKHWPLIGVVVVSVILLVASVGLSLRPGLKRTSEQIHLGMRRADVEVILGPPAISLGRAKSDGHLFAWVDQFWQVTVTTDDNGRVEAVTCVPSDSAYRRTEVVVSGWFN